jgi:hypothetical protein
MSDDGTLELLRAHRATKEKYIYFLLAAAGAGIGFAVNKTRDASLSWSMMPLAASVACWGLSFYFGCRQATEVAALLYENYNFLRLKSGELAEIPPHPQVVADIWGLVEKRFKNSGRYGNRQFEFLIADAVFYIGWHVLEMYLRTK